jgi:hypothetical protein
MDGFERKRKGFKIKENDQKAALEAQECNNHYSLHPVQLTRH